MMVKYTYCSQPFMRECITVITTHQGVCTMTTKFDVWDEWMSQVTSAVLSCRSTSHCPHHRLLMWSDECFHPGVAEDRQAADWQRHTSHTVKLRRVELYLNETPSQSYWVSLDIWDLGFTSHPTQVNTIHPTFPQPEAGTRFIYPRRMSWPRWLVTYRDGLPAHRQSPVQVLTQQCTAGNQTRNLLITSPIP